MEPTSVCVRLFLLVAYISILATTFFTTLTDARTIHELDYTKADQSYGLISTPLSPTPLPSPDPFCKNPPSTYAPPHLALQSPPPGTPQSPPQGTPQSPSPSPNPPAHVPTPPTSTPTPPHYGSSPPKHAPTPPTSTPTPPHYGPSPPKHAPSPPQYTPSPPIYQPPVVHPPPVSIPPPPHKKPRFAVWCVAKPTVPDPIVQEAMDYACGSGADCKSIQPNQPCFQPNTLFSHASYAFNSYWQNTKIGGGTCDFGGTAMLVTTDPSYDNCHFIYK